jgi:mannose/fructose-specific phosphotransferase system component IIA
MNDKLPSQIMSDDQSPGHKSRLPVTGLVLVTHGQIGRSLLDVAEFILDQSLAEVGFVSFRQSAMEHTGTTEISDAIHTADQGQGVLVLTDIGGASPCNQVACLLPGSTAELVTGLNLAMLIRAWNYRQEPAPRLAVLAAEGAIRDIREFHS